MPPHRVCLLPKSGPPWESVPPTENVFLPWEHSSSLRPRILPESVSPTWEYAFYLRVCLLPENMPLTWECFLPESARPSWEHAPSQKACILPEKMSLTRLLPESVSPPWECVSTLRACLLLDNVPFPTKCASIQKDAYSHKTHKIICGNNAPQITYVITIHQEIILIIKIQQELTTQSWWCAGSCPENKSGWSSTEPHHDNLYTSRSKFVNIQIHSESPHQQRVEIEHYFDAYFNCVTTFKTL